MKKPATSNSSLDPIIILFIFRVDNTEKLWCYVDPKYAGCGDLVPSVYPDRMISYIVIFSSKDALIP